MKQKFNESVAKLGRFAKNPYVQMFMAVVLIVSSITEGWGSMAADVSHGRLRAFHGTLLLGIVHLLRTLPDVVEAIERAAEVAGSTAVEEIEAEEERPS
jgi:heme/copper-type cytochrome/quinol oxidase subunit 3